MTSFSSCTVAWRTSKSTALGPPDQGVGPICSVSVAAERGDGGVGRRRRVRRRADGHHLGQVAGDLRGVDTLAMPVGVLAPPGRRWSHLSAGTMISEGRGGPRGEALLDQVLAGDRPDGLRESLGVGQVGVEVEEPARHDHSEQDGAAIQIGRAWAVSNPPSRTHNRFSAPRDGVDARLPRGTNGQNTPRPAIRRSMGRAVQHRRRPPPPRRWRTPVPDPCRS